MASHHDAGGRRGRGVLAPGRCDVPASGHCAAAVQMRRAVSGHSRTARPKLDAMKFIDRKPPTSGTFDRRHS